MKGIDNMCEATFLTAKDIAKIMGCSEKTAREIMRRADFPLIRVGKNYKVEESAFEKWTKKRRV